MGQVHRASMSSKCITLPESPTQSSPNPSFWEASLHRHVWLNHWPLLIDSNPSSSSSWRSPSGIQSSNPLNTQWALLATSPHLRLCSKSHLINITKYTFMDLITGNSKGFWSSVLEMGMKTSISYYKSQDHRSFSQKLKGPFRLELPTEVKPERCVWKVFSFVSLFSARKNPGAPGSLELQTASELGVLAPWGNSKGGYLWSCWCKNVQTCKEFLQDFIWAKLTTVPGSKSQMLLRMAVLQFLLYIWN